MHDGAVADLPPPSVPRGTIKKSDSMQIDWYKKHGFEVSSLIDQSTINRAEADVRQAYVTPILGAEAAGDDVDMAVGNLAFLLVLQRSIMATRAGAKIKNTQTSQNAETWAIVAQECASCHQRLEMLRAKPEADSRAEVFDICKIYFKSNFLSL